MSAHLERESGPLRFVVDAVALHRRHAYEFDVPLPGRAEHDARDALSIAPHAHLRDRRGITQSPGTDQPLGNRPAVRAAPARQRVTDDREAWMGSGTVLAGLPQAGFEAPGQ